MLGEKLVVEIVAVDQHHERQVLYRRMPHHAHGEEEHGATLSTAIDCYRPFKKRRTPSHQ
jgi:hypothetical protein